MVKPKKNYSPASKMMHWLAALVIIGLLIVGMVMEEMANGPDKFELMGLHKSFGVVALILLALRIPLRLINPVLPLPGTPAADVLKAKAIKALLYILMFVMPVSGILMSQAGGHPVAMFGLELPSLLAENEELHEIFEAVHGIASKVLIAAILLHVAAALFHHFIKRDDTLKRMSFRK